MVGGLDCREPNWSRGGRRLEVQGRSVGDGKRGEGIFGFWQEKKIEKARKSDLRPVLSECSSLGEVKRALYGEGRRFLVSGRREIWPAGIGELGEKTGEEYLAEARKSGTPNPGKAQKMPNAEGRKEKLSKEDLFLPS